MPRVLLFGAGSVGSIYVYVLSRAGADVTAVCRSNYTAVKQNGFFIDSSIFGENIDIKPNVVRTPAEAEGKFDYIVVCSKALLSNSPSIPSLVKPVISSNTTIVLIQNGVGIESEFSSAFPSNPILSCVVYLPVTQTRPGIISHGHDERLEVGTYPSNAPREHKGRAEAFAGLVTAGGATAQVFEDIQPRRWRKTIINAAWNPICALTHLNDVDFLASSLGAVTLMEDVMVEVVSVARALGYSEVTQEVAEAQLQRAKQRMKGIEPSMLGDVREGRRMEVEAILGNVVRFGQEKGVTTPLLTMLYCLTKGLEESIVRRHEEQ